MLHAIIYSSYLWMSNFLFLPQMIALIYKDQHRHNLQRLLALWMETELSESSEDNESNTSPQVRNAPSLVRIQGLSSVDLQYPKNKTSPQGPSWPSVLTWTSVLQYSWFFHPQDQNGSCSSPVLTSAENDDSSDGVSSQPGNGHSDKEGSCK